MKLLKKWRKDSRRDDSRHAPLAKRSAGGGGTELIARLRDEMDQAFDRVWHDFGRDPWSTFDRLGRFEVPTLGTWPAVDVSHDEKSVTWRFDVPGLDERDLDVEVSGNVLTVRGTREQANDDEKRGRHERATASFMRTVSLPAYVDGSNVEARYARGVLTVTAPRVPGKGPKRVNLTA